MKLVIVGGVAGGASAALVEFDATESIDFLDVFSVNSSKRIFHALLEAELSGVVAELILDAVLVQDRKLGWIDFADVTEKVSGHVAIDVGAFDFFANFDAGHFDLPMMGTTIELDGVAVIREGVLQDVFG